MSRIRSLAPTHCPECGAERSFVVSRDQTACSRCGHVLRQAEASPTPEPATRDLSQYRAYYRIRHDNGDVSPYVGAIFTTAMDYVHRQQWPEAIQTFKRLLVQESRFFDAHLWLGRLLDDRDERLKHLESAVAERPDDGEAVRELLVERGEIAAGIDDFQMAQVREAGGAVAAEAQNLRCPKCGSTRLQDDEDSDALYCGSCGWEQPKPKARGAGESLLMTAMLQRRSQPVQWVVRERVLKCDSCGAQRTLPAAHMTHQCVFCGSQQVIERDALESFEQPDVIVPFNVSEQAARAHLTERLNSRIERMKGWFLEKRIDSLNVMPIYLPFWVYDVIAEVSRTVIAQPNADRQRVQRVVTPYSNMRYAEIINDVFVPAVTQPARGLLFQLGRYKLSNAVTFEPQMIAQRSAELYSIDFDKAAMDAHGIVSDAMREKYGTKESSYEQVTVFTMMKSMSFTLALVPVWLFTLIEKDGEVRQALVNGQSGRLVLGRARKPQA